MSIIRSGYGYKKHWWFFALLAFLFFFYEQLGVWRIDKAALIGIALLFAFAFLRLVPDYFKVRSPKLATNPWFDTTTGDPYYAGDYILYTRGGIRTSKLNINGRSGTVAVLNDGNNTIGMNRVLTPKCEQVELAELPPEVISVVKEHGLPAPYYLGLAHEDDYDRKQLDSSGEQVLIGSQVSMIRIENAIHRAYDSIMRNAAEPIEDTLKMIRRIQATAEPETTDKTALKKIFIKEEQ